jgi:hypothetical protein
MATTQINGKKYHSCAKIMEKKKYIKYPGKNDRNACFPPGHIFC